MKNWKILWLTFLCVFLLSGYSFAALINPRPVSPLGDNGTEDTLQEVFDSITTSGPGIDAVNDQIENAIFDNTASGVSTATFIIEIAGYAGTNEFGIYEYSDPSNKALIFDGGDGAGDQVSVTFNSDGTIGVTQLGPGGSYTQAATDFTGSFGFYIDVYGAGPDSGFDYTFYSEDDLNPNDDPQALIYQGDDETVLQLPGKDPGTFIPGEFIIAFEDLVYETGDRDFQDLVVMVESIKAVPEPTTVVISSLFLIGAGFFVRRKLHTKS